MRWLLARRGFLGAPLAITASLFLASCGDSGGTTTPPTPTIGVALGSSTLDLTQGQSNTVTVDVTRGGGYTGAVDLSLEGAPGGVSGTFSPASVPAGSSSSTLTLSATTAAAVGTHQLTVRAGGQGVSEQSAALALTVAELPSIALSVEPGVLSVTQATSESVTITITRTNFTGAVDLSLEGAPAGVSGSFDPASLAGGATTSTLTPTAAADAAIGASELVIRARGEGVEDRAGALALTIDPAPAYTMTLQPTSLSLQQGASGTAQIQLVRTNFAGAVALSVSGAPSGVTASVSPASVTDDAATLMVNVGAAASPGNHTLTVTGQAQGLENRIATLQLSVMAAPPTSNWVQVSAGRDHPCAVDERADAFCWGRNQYGQLGDGTTTMRMRPRLVTGGHTWTGLTAGLFHTCGITAAGDGFCWGNGNFGLGDGSTASSSTPQPITVSGGDTWALLSAGHHFTCGLTPDGRAYCWGRNGYGELGDGTGRTQLTPVLVAGDHSWQTVSAGVSHACGITAAGEAYCWGQRLWGAVGDGGGTGNAWVPTLVQGGHTWMSISAGQWHTCGITTAGAGYCWGYNGFGQLGTGNTESQSTPTLILNDHVWTNLKPGSLHTTCGITGAGEAYCWGANAVGQLGNGTESRHEAIPQLVSGDFRWNVVSGGHGYTCGITIAGVAYCWGSSSYGQLGVGSPSSPAYLTPTRVLDPQ